ncbi:hypothetical protein JCM10135_03040 [Stetteria hydrogenophila]
MGTVEVVVEATRSRRGRHVARAVALVVGPAGARPVRPGAGSRRVRGTYSRGAAYAVEVSLNPGEALVLARLVRGPGGRVKGEFLVYNHEGRLVLEAVYRRLKVRRRRGDPGYAWAVEEAVKALGIERYVKRFNWSTGSPA